MEISSETRAVDCNKFKVFVLIVSINLLGVFRYVAADPFNSIGELEFSGRATGIVRDIVSNKYGVFLAAENGLFRLAGNSVTVFDSNNSGLGRGVIADLYDDSENLWIAEYGNGVFRYNYYTEELEKFEIEDTQNVWGIGKVNGSVIIAAIDSIHVFDSSGHKVSTNTFEGKKIRGAYQVAIGKNAYISTYDGIAVVKKGTLQFLKREDYFSEIGEITSVYTFSEKIAVGGKEGLLIYNENFTNKEFFALKNSDIPVEKIFSDSEGKVWVSAGKLYYAESDSDSLESPGWLNPVISSVYSETITALSESQQGELYLSSSQLGLIKITNIANSMNYLSEKGKIFRENVEYFTDAKDNFYAISDESVYQLTASNGKINKISDSIGSEQEKCYLFFSSLDLKKFNIHCDNVIKFLKHRYKDEFIIYFSDGKKNFIGRINNKDLELVNLDYTASFLTVTKQGDVLMMTPQGNVLVQVSRFLWRDIANLGRLYEDATCFFAISVDKVVICSQKFGVTTLNIIKGNFVGISNLKLGTKYIRGAVALNDDYYLFATNNGLYAYAVEHKKTIPVREEAGVFDIDFEYGAITLNENNFIVNGDKYSYVFDKDLFLTALDALGNRQTRILIKKEIAQSINKNVDSSTIHEISHSDNINNQHENISFKIIPSDYSRNEKRLIELKLEGIDKNWRTLPYESQSVDYANLPPGEFEFSARVVDPISKVKQPIASVVFKGAIPFWRTQEAALGFFFLLGTSFLITYGIWSGFFRTLIARFTKLIVEQQRYIKRNYRTTENLVAIKQKAFVDLSHSIRSPISTIAACIAQENSDLSRIGSEISTAQVKACVDELIAAADLVSDLDKLDECLNNDLELCKISEVAPLLLAGLKDSVPEHIQLDCSVHGDSILYLTRGALSEILFCFISRFTKAMNTNDKIYVSFDCQALHVNLTVSLAPVSSSNIARLGDELPSKAEETNTFHVDDGYDLISGIISLNGGWLERFVDGDKLLRLSAIIPVSDVFRGRYKKRENLPEKMSDLAEIVESCKFQRNKPVILFIEANDDIRQLLFNMLNNSYCCLFAWGMDDAMSIAEVISPNILILDYVTNGSSGIKIVRQLRQLKPMNELSVIMTTSLSLQTVRNEANRMGIDHVLPKPLDETLLRFAIESSLELREAFAVTASDTRSNSSEVCDIDQPTPEFKNAKDQNFYLKFIALVKKNYNSESFTRSYVAGQMAMSERQLNRRMAELFDYNYTEFIKLFRLKKSEQLLIAQVPITTVAYEVGFSSSSYFSTCFKSVYNITPKQFQEDAFKDNLRDSK